ncbi:MAG TPA: nucleotide exchange factor GrpE [Novimethylophilus sp.]|jgi:molecular chaperone GrpE|uniref:nucleotide exchange factor GrpE n=1 Tax=Novimethylophilus sp. TaxID=2137426 RepID=UPI002F3FA3C2
MSQENQTPEQPVEGEQLLSAPSGDEPAGRQPEQGNVEMMPSLEDMLQDADRRAQEHYDAWMYAKAEGENIRRRAQDDIEKARKFALEKFSSELLAVKDSMEAALNVGTATVESYRNGVELTLKQLASVLEKFNVLEVAPVGEKFDPHKHQAISMVEADAEPNTVINVLQKGYTLHDRVLRPALVVVSKGKN